MGIRLESEAENCIHHRGHTGHVDTSALQRNLAFGRKHKITGTPTLIFTDGSRVPGAIGAKDVEKRLAEATQ